MALVRVIPIWALMRIRCTKQTCSDVYAPPRLACREIWGFEILLAGGCSRGMVILSCARHFKLAPSFSSGLRRKYVILSMTIRLTQYEPVKTKVPLKGSASRRRGPAERWIMRHV